MALLPCPECGKEVSSKAIACPTCAHPLNTDEPIISKPQNIVTTQATSKHFKAIQFIGVALILAGTVSCSVGEPSTSVRLWIFGVAIYVGGRIGAWWNHG